jgi:hypothetical protein
VRLLSRGKASRTVASLLQLHCSVRAPAGGDSEVLPSVITEPPADRDIRKKEKKL